jgi:hypothetical protein
MAFGAVFMIKLGACWKRPALIFAAEYSTAEISKPYKKHGAVDRRHDFKHPVGQQFFITVASNYNMPGQFPANI